MRIIENLWDRVKWEENGEVYIAMKNHNYWATPALASDTFTAILDSIQNPKEIEKNINQKLKIIK